MRKGWQPKPRLEPLVTPSTPAPETCIESPDQDAPDAPPAQDEKPDEGPIVECPWCDNPLRLGWCRVTNSNDDARGVRVRRRLCPYCGMSIKTEELIAGKTTNSKCDPAGQDPS